MAQVIEHLLSKNKPLSPNLSTAKKEKEKKKKEIKRRKIIERKRKYTGTYVNITDIWEL
jgi:hypothetical protein